MSSCTPTPLCWHTEPVTEPASAATWLVHALKRKEGWNREHTVDERARKYVARRRGVSQR